MRRRDVRSYLHDSLEAAQLLEEFSAGQSLDDYAADAKLHSAVERQFEIVGEALNQALRLRPELAASITGNHRIIASRNRLIHGYASISYDVVWSVSRDDLPLLRSQVERLLHEQEGYA